jgi:hypothetical protein
MQIVVPRLILGLLLVGTLFPVLAIAGLGWSLMTMGTAFTAMFHGKVLFGLSWLLWSVCAFYGLVVVAELLVHYWHSPWRNPPTPMLRRSAIGLVMWWVSFPLLIPVARSDATFGAYAVGMSILLIPVPLIVSVLLLYNYLRARRAANSTPHTDARASAAPDQPPSARAGERGR